MVVGRKEKFEVCGMACSNPDSPLRDALGLARGQPWNFSFTSLPFHSPSAVSAVSALKVITLPD